MSKKKLFDSIGLAHLWSELKTKFAPISHAHSEYMKTADYTNSSGKVKEAETANDATYSAYAGKLIDTTNLTIPPEMANVGSATQPVYFADGVPVPANEIPEEYTLPVATSGALGGVKSGGNITVSSDGAVTVNSATKATNDKNGNDISRIYCSMIPAGTAISANSDLNTTAFLKVGNYYCSKNADVATLTNCPTTMAFMMQVYSPLSTTIDNESKTWVYRLRKLITHKGEEYYQFVNSGATGGVFTYGSWVKNITASDAATTSKAGLMSAADKVKVNGMEASISTALTNAKAYTDEKVDPIPDYVKTEAERVAEQVRSHQNANTFSFIAFSDAHYDKDSESVVNGIIHAGQAMELIRKAVNIDFAVNLGDNTWGSSVSGDETTIEVGLEEIREVNKLIYPAFNGIPNFRVAGNHDNLTFNYTFNGNNYLDENELFPLFGIYNRGAVYQDGEKDRGYCYRDFEEFKLRVIMLNLNDHKELTVNDDTYQYTNGVQMKWFAETIDLSDKDDAADWSVLIFSHQPLDFGISIFCNNILKAYLEGGSYTKTRDGVTINCNYAGKNQATIIGNVHGHNHNFLVDDLRSYINDTTTEAIGVKRMCVPNACYYRANERGNPTDTADIFDIDYGEDTTYDKTAGTAEDTAFYVITVDTAEKKMYLDHYGAGYSQEVVYYVAPPSYTNVLPTAQVYTSGDTSALDGVGYRDGYYMTSSGGVGSAASGYTCTGAIPYARKADGTYPTIYVKGATFEATSQSRIYLYGCDTATVPKGILNPASYGGNGASPANVNKLWTKEVLADGYWRFIPTAEFNAMETVNGSTVGYVGMSLKGSGANTIITLDEPIED